MVEASWRETQRDIGSWAIGFFSVRSALGVWLRQDGECYSIGHLAVLSDKQRGGGAFPA